MGGSVEKSAAILPCERIPDVQFNDKTKRIFKTHPRETVQRVRETTTGQVFCDMHKIPTASGLQQRQNTN